MVGNLGVRPVAVADIGEGLGAPWRPAGIDGYHDEAELRERGPRYRIVGRHGLHKAARGIDQKRSAVKGIDHRVALARYEVGRKIDNGADIGLAVRRLDQDALRGTPA